MFSIYFLTLSLANPRHFFYELLLGRLLIVEVGQHIAYGILGLREDLKGGHAKARGIAHVLHE